MRTTSGEPGESNGNESLKNGSSGLPSWPRMGTEAERTPRLGGRKNFWFGSYWMRTVSLLILCLFLSVTPTFAASEKVCPGSAAIGKLGMFVKPAKAGPALPLDAVNEIRAGDRLEYRPGPRNGKRDKKAKIAVVLVPSDSATGNHVTVLKVEPAEAAAQWKVPFRTSVVGLVLGPSGLSVKKVSSFVKKNPNLIPQMADYAERASKIEALVQTLSKYEQSKPGTTTLQSALDGFSSQYGVKLPAVNASQSTTTQANELLHALLPAVSSQQPLTSGKALLKGSTGLAASVASLFFGSPVGLAAGGTVLFENLRTTLFPRTDFRAAFVQDTNARRMTFCGNNANIKSGTRVAYFWVRRVPDAAAPTVALVHAARLPLDWVSTVQVTTASVAQLKLLSRARAWRLVSGKDAVAVPVKVAVGSADDSLALDFRHLKLTPGSYHLAAKWDWTPLPVAGTIALVSFPDLGSAAVTPSSEDRLIEGNGVQWARLTGADFEFVDHAALVSGSQPGASPVALSFTLPSVKSPGEQNSMDVEMNCDGLAPGSYELRLSQRNGSIHNVPVTIHPPNPVIAHLPLRLNFGEASQTVLLRGTGLGRIVRVTSPHAAWKLAPAPAGAGDLSQRKATIALAPGARQGERLPASVFVEGLHEPVAVHDAIEVIGPLPKIVSVRKSSASQAGVQLLTGEIPGEAPVSFLIQAEHAGSRPTLDLACGESGDGTPKLALVAGTRQGSSEFDATGPDSFFLSLDPGSVSPAGCLLTAAIVNQATGISAPFPLGRVILLPRIDKFTLSAEKEGRDLYIGTLTGRNLQVIEKTGWDRKRGFAVLGIPTPVPGSPREQTLQIVMPWPPPSPDAPLFIWLQGENEGRRTSATY